MNFVSRTETRVAIRQIPILLLFVGAFFSLPFIASSLIDFIGGVEAESRIFGLVFGFLLLWLFLEFVATRDRIEIDTVKKTLTRTVSGVFRIKKQAIGLGEARKFKLENIPCLRGGLPAFVSLRQQ